MGIAVPELSPDLDDVDDPSADALLSSLRTISAPERRKHASVHNYWLSIRGSRQLPPIHDLDPLEISDAGPFSILMEMIGGGEDAEIRHLGVAIKAGIEAEKISEAPNPSLLSCIAPRLQVVAGCRDAFAFEDSFESADGKTRCWVTLLPFSATGNWIDFVYAFVTLDPAPGAADAEMPLAEPEDDAIEPEAALPQELVQEAEPVEAIETPVDFEPVEEDSVLELEEPATDEQGPTPGFSARFMEGVAKISGFYGTPVETNIDAFTVGADTRDEPAAEEQNEPQPDEPAAEEPDEPQAEEPVAEAPDEPQADEPNEIATESTSTLEASLQTKLTEVRSKADEARQAKLRANAALYEGLSAAYDFALDAENSPEDYLKLVQAEGLKIQLRSPMRPVAKLAFDGLCDEATIEQIEAILAWAFDEELPRGTLADKIEAAGGIGPILSGQARAA